MSATIFQFHKGAIRTDVGSCNQNALSDFNSIKVRLEPDYVYLHNDLTQFQFHKGAIRTR